MGVVPGLLLRRALFAEVEELVEWPGDQLAVAVELQTPALARDGGVESRIDGVDVIDHRIGPVIGMDDSGVGGDVRQHIVEAFDHKFHVYTPQKRKAALVGRLRSVGREYFYLRMAMPQRSPKPARFWFEFSRARDMVSSVRGALVKCCARVKPGEWDNLA